MQRQAPKFIFMKKQVKLTVKETTAKNSDFYNLFRPIAPSIDIIGKVAQVISGLTEAITIWYITQSEMAGSSKFISIAVSIVATLLVVAILEIGGRKFLQVITRALVWKRLKNAWYMALFAIVGFITIGIAVISFRLSTNGIKHAFVSNVPAAVTIDDSAFRKDYRTGVKELTSQFKDELQLMKDNHQQILTSTSEKYDTKITAANLKVDSYTRKYKRGTKWAKSQADKYRKKANQLETEKADLIVGLNKAHTKKVDAWQARKNKAIASEKAQLKERIAEAKATGNQVHQSKYKNAAFWGSLFSFLVGFSVILAFICIITVEVYRRGAGIEVEYHEEDQDPSIFEMFWHGLKMRTDGFFRSKVERFAKVSNTSSGRSSIGFGYPTQVVNSNSNSQLPTAEMDDMNL